MIDTVRFVIPIQDENIYKILRYCCDKEQSQNGEFLFSVLKLNFHTYKMDLPSYATGLNIQILENQINVEGSVPKNLLGNNIQHSQPNDIQKFIDLIQTSLEALLNNPPTRINGKNHTEGMVNLIEWGGGAIKLLPPDYWKLQRIDICYNWHLDTQEQVIAYINAFKRFTDGMKNTTDYQERGMEIRKKDYKIKLYNKHLEYLEHDHKKLIKENIEIAQELIEKSKGVLRFEVGLRKDQIEYEFQVKDRTWGNLKKFFQDDNKTLELLDKYIQKMTNKFQTKVLTEKEVLRNLQILYGSKMSLKLWGFYNSLKDKEYLQTIPKKTKASYRKMLKKAQIGLVSEVNLPKLELPTYTPTPKRTKETKLKSIWNILKS